LGLYNRIEVQSKGVRIPLHASIQPVTVSKRMVTRYDGISTDHYRGRFPLVSPTRGPYEYRVLVGYRNRGVKDSAGYKQGSDRIQKLVLVG
jgi:hypothetical protein